MLLIGPSVWCLCGNNDFEDGWIFSYEILIDYG